MNTKKMGSIFMVAAFSILLFNKAIHCAQDLKRLLAIARSAGNESEIRRIQEELKKLAPGGGASAEALKKAQEEKAAAEEAAAQARAAEEQAKKQAEEEKKQAEEEKKQRERAEKAKGEAEKKIETFKEDIKKIDELKRELEVFKSGERILYLRDLKLDQTSVVDAFKSFFTAQGTSSVDEELIKNAAKDSTIQTFISPSTASLDEQEQNFGDILYCLCVAISDKFPNTLFHEVIKILIAVKNDVFWKPLSGLQIMHVAFESLVVRGGAPPAPPPPPPPGFGGFKSKPAPASKPTKVMTVSEKVDAEILNFVTKAAKVQVTINDDIDQLMPAITDAIQSKRDELLHDVKTQILDVEKELRKDASLTIKEAKDTVSSITEFFDREKALIELNEQRFVVIVLRSLDEAYNKSIVHDTIRNWLTKQKIIAKQRDENLLLAKLDTGLLVKDYTAASNTIDAEKRKKLYDELVNNVQQYVQQYVQDVKDKKSTQSINDVTQAVVKMIGDVLKKIMWVESFDIEKKVIQFIVEQICDIDTTIDFPSMKTILESAVIGKKLGKKMVYNPIEKKNEEKDIEIDVDMLNKSLANLYLQRVIDVIIIPTSGSAEDKLQSVLQSIQKEAKDTWKFPEAFLKNTIINYLKDPKTVGILDQDEADAIDFKLQRAIFSSLYPRPSGTAAAAFEASLKTNFPDPAELAKKESDPLAVFAAMQTKKASSSTTPTTATIASSIATTPAVSAPSVSIALTTSRPVAPITSKPVLIKNIADVQADLNKELQTYQLDTSVNTMQIFQKYLEDPAVGQNILRFRFWIGSRVRDFADYNAYKYKKGSIDKSSLMGLHCVLLAQAHNLVVLDVLKESTVTDPRDHADSDGQYPLHLLFSYDECGDDFKKICPYLISTQAINAKDAVNGDAPLHLAVRKVIVISKGRKKNERDVNLKNQSKVLIDIIKLLINSGADISSENDTSKMPYDLLFDEKDAMHQNEIRELEKLLGV